MAYNISVIKKIYHYRSVSGKVSKKKKHWTHIKQLVPYITIFVNLLKALRIAKVRPLASDQCLSDNAHRPLSSTT